MWGMHRTGKGVQWEGKREWTEREIRGGEGGLEIGCNS